MKDVTIKEITITENRIKAIIHLDKQLSEYDIIDGRRIRDEVMEEVKNTAVDLYLKNHLHEIMAKIDQQQILNMITLTAAKRVSDR